MEHTMKRVRPSLEAATRLHFTPKTSVSHHVVIVVIRVLLVEVGLPLDGHLGLFLHLRAHLRERKPRGTREQTNDGQEKWLPTLEAPRRELAAPPPVCHSSASCYTRCCAGSTALSPTQPRESSRCWFAHVGDALSVGVLTETPTSRTWRLLPTNLALPNVNKFNN